MAIRPIDPGPTDPPRTELAITTEETAYEIEICEEGNFNGWIRSTTWINMDGGTCR